MSEKEEQEAQDLRTKLERAFVVQPVDKLDAPLDVAIEEAAKVAVGVAKQEIIASGVLMIFMESYDKNSVILHMETLRFLLRPMN